MPNSSGFHLTTVVNLMNQLINRSMFYSFRYPKDNPYQGLFEKANALLEKSKDKIDGQGELPDEYSQEVTELAQEYIECNKRTVKKINEEGGGIKTLENAVLEMDDVWLKGIVEDGNDIFQTGDIHPAFDVALGQIVQLRIPGSEPEAQQIEEALKNYPVDTLFDLATMAQRHQNEALKLKRAHEQRTAAELNPEEDLDYHTRMDGVHRETEVILDFGRQLQELGAETSSVHGSGEIIFQSKESFSGSTGFLQNRGLGLLSTSCEEWLENDSDRMQFANGLRGKQAREADWEDKQKKRIAEEREQAEQRRLKEQQRRQDEEDGISKIDRQIMDEQVQKFGKLLDHGMENNTIVELNNYVFAKQQMFLYRFGPGEVNPYDLLQVEALTLMSAGPEAMVDTKLQTRTQKANGWGPFTEEYKKRAIALAKKIRETNSKVAEKIKADNNGNKTLELSVLNMDDCWLEPIVEEGLDVRRNREAHPAFGPVFSQSVQLKLPDTMSEGEQIEIANSHYKVSEIMDLGTQIQRKFHESAKMEKDGRGETEEYEKLQDEIYALTISIQDKWKKLQDKTEEYGNGKKIFQSQDSFNGTNGFLGERGIALLNSNCEKWIKKYSKRQAARQERLKEQALEREQKEQERLAREEEERRTQEEKERREKEEKERIEKEEKEREKERLEKERLEKERLEKERQEKIKNIRGEIETNKKKHRELQVQNNQMEPELQKLKDAAKTQKSRLEAAKADLDEAKEYLRLANADSKAISDALMKKSAEPLRTDEYEKTAGYLQILKEQCTNKLTQLSEARKTLTRKSELYKSFEKSLTDFAELSNDADPDKVKEQAEKVKLAANAYRASKQKWYNTVLWGVFGRMFGRGPEQDCANIARSLSEFENTAKQQADTHAQARKANDVLNEKFNQFTKDLAGFSGMNKEAAAGEMSATCNKIMEFHGKLKEDLKELGQNAMEMPAVKGLVDKLGFLKEDKNDAFEKKLPKSGVFLA